MPLPRREDEDELLDYTPGALDFASLLIDNARTLPANAALTMSALGNIGRGILSSAGAGLAGGAAVARETVRNPMELLTNPSAVGERAMQAGAETVQSGIENSPLMRPMSPEVGARTQQVGKALAAIPEAAGALAGDIAGPGAQTLAENLVDPLEGGGKLAALGVKAALGVPPAVLSMAGKGALDVPTMTGALDVGPGRAREFTSGLARAIEEAPMKEGTPAQWKAVLNPQRNQLVRKDEIEWSGIHDWLDNIAGNEKQGELFGPNTLTKQQVLDQVRAAGLPEMEVKEFGEGVLYNEPKAPKNPAELSDELNANLDETTGEYVVYNPMEGPEYFANERDAQRRYEELDSEYREEFDRNVKKEVDRNIERFKQDVVTDYENQRNIEEVYELEDGTIVRADELPEGAEETATKKYQIEYDGDLEDTNSAYDTMEEAQKALTENAESYAEDNWQEYAPTDRYGNLAPDYDASHDAHSEGYYEGDIPSVTENDYFDEDAFEALKADIAKKQSPEAQKQYERELEQFHEKRRAYLEGDEAREAVPLGIRRVMKSYGGMTLADKEGLSRRVRMLYSKPEGSRRMFEQEMKELTFEEVPQATELRTAFDINPDNEGYRVTRDDLFAERGHKNASAPFAQKRMFETASDTSYDFSSRQFAVRDKNGKLIGSFRPSDEDFAAMRDLNPAEQQDYLRKAALDDWLSEDADYTGGHFSGSEGHNILSFTRTQTVEGPGGSSTFINEKQSDMVQHALREESQNRKRGNSKRSEERLADAAFARHPFEHDKPGVARPQGTNWWRTSFNSTIGDAIARGDASISWPADGNQVADIEGWPEGAESRDEFKPIIERYTKDMPAFARQIGRKYGVEPVQQQVTFGDGTKHTVWVLPFNDKMRADYKAKGVPAFSLQGGALDLKKLGGELAGRAVETATGMAKSQARGALDQSPAFDEDEEEKRRKRRQRGALDTR